jgi:hypothetical protein
VACSECDRLLTEFRRLADVHAKAMKFLREYAGTEFGVDSDALRIAAYQAEGNSRIIWREFTRHQQSHPEASDDGMLGM